MSIPVYQSNSNLCLNAGLSSNINNTTVQTSFPTTTTGSSLGHYHYIGSDGNNKKTDFFNMSGSQEGGFNFWTSSSTVAPTKILSVSKDAVNLNTVLANTSNLTNLNLAENKLLIQTTNSQRTEVNGNTFSARNTATSDNSRMQSDNFAVGNDIENKFASIYNTFFSVADPSHSSKLTSTDLTFDNVSLVSTVSTNTSNIATNTSNIATNTSNIATNTTNIATNTSNITTLTIKQINILNVFSSPAIYADGAAPLTVPITSSNTYAQFGWYFKNLIAGQKINWYFPPDTNQTVGDVLGLYLRLFNCSTVSNDNSPFIIIYTKPTGSGDYASWYHSSMVYILDSTVTPTVNTNYTFFKNVSGTCPNPAHYSSSLVNMIQSPVNNPRGNYAPNQQILTIAIGSNSASAVNSVEFVMQKLGIMTASGTTEFNVGFQL